MGKKRVRRLLNVMTFRNVEKYAEAFASAEKEATMQFEQLIQQNQTGIRGIDTNVEPGMDCSLVASSASRA